jgi:hypothetical protein
MLEAQKNARLKRMQNLQAAITGSDSLRPAVQFWS